MSILVGVVRGTAALTRIDGPLACASTRASFGIRAAVLGSFALLHAGIALLPVTLVESGFDASAVLGDAVRLSLVLMTTVAFGCLLLHLPLPPGSAPWILAVGAFVAPLLQPQVVPDRSLGLLACALLTAGWLLDHPPGRTA